MSGLISGCWSTGGLLPRPIEADAAGDLMPPFWIDPTDAATLY